MFIDIYGNDLPGWPTTITSSDSVDWVPRSDLIVVDIDGDNYCEIFSDFNMYVFDNSNPDSIFTWSYLFAADHEGSSLSGYPIITRGCNLSMPPTFTRCQETNQLYMGVCTYASEGGDSPSFNYVELYRFPDSAGPLNQWPMLGHDNLMTRNYNFVDNVTAIRDGEQPLPKSYVLTQNYPNPFNNSTIIEFALPQSGDVNITVYDILGRRVEALLDEELPAGNHQVTWQADNYASGMYFYRLTAENIELSRKMLLLK